jgi:hypothetical protein
MKSNLVLGENCALKILKLRAEKFGTERPQAAHKAPIMNKNNTEKYE